MNTLHNHRLHAALALLWALPALGAAAALTTGGHSPLRSLLLITLVIAATLAAALLPALLIHAGAHGRGPLNNAQTAAWTAAALSSLNLALASFTPWAGGPTTTFWLACALLLAAATAYLARTALRPNGKTHTRAANPDEDNGLYLTTL